MREYIFGIQKKRNRQKPETIVFYSDGFSEGQLEQVKNSEIRAIRPTCEGFKLTETKPSIMFLVMQKRHHIRLFPRDLKDSVARNIPEGK